MEGEIVTLGKYKVDGILGRGAMGTVYRAFDPVIERTVAIKTMRRVDSDDEIAREAEARFIREAKAAGRLTHPNIVGVYDFGEDGDNVFIVMELVEGRTLKALIESGEALPVKDVVGIMTSVLAALDYSHRNEVIHRDIKPANILLTVNRDVKIMDFGVAKIESSTMTQAGTLLGTPSYMSPEQFLGEEADARSDLFSAGAVLYELLTGQKPFSGSFATVMQKVVNQDPPMPTTIRAQIPPAFDRVTARALAKKAADRYQSAGEFIADLRAALLAQESPGVVLSEPGIDDATVVISASVPRDLPPMPPPPVAAPANVPEIRKTGRPGAGRALLLGGGAVAVLALAGGLAWLFLAQPARLSPTPPVLPAKEKAIPAPQAEEAPPAPQPVFASVSVTTERGRAPVYRVGEKLHMSATVSAEAFLYCFYQQAGGEVFRIFPNRAMPNPRLSAGQKLQLPEGAGFDIRFDVPDAQETVACLASPVGLTAIEPTITSAEALSPLPYASIRMLLDVVAQHSENRVSSDLIDIKVTK